jgi:rhamnosyltransferase
LEVSKQSGFTVLSIHAKDFNHGGTRQWALDQGLEKANQLGQPKPDLVVYLTHDAVLAHENSLQELLNAFQNPQVAASYGRQIPKSNANWLETHTRHFNYPKMSKTVTLKDKASLGIKACFLSNSFAAYRLQALQAMGGFPSNLPLGEDTYTAAKLLLSGQSLHYQASAAVYHSHNYNGTQDFQRMFDTGVFHAQNPWLLQSFGKAEGEGLKLVRSQWSFLMAQSGQVNQPPVIQGVLQWLTSNALKWLGYKLGHVHRYLPTALVKKFSMHKAFWNTPAHASSGQSHP